MRKLIIIATATLLSLPCLADSARQKTINQAIDSAAQVAAATPAEEQLMESEMSKLDSLAAVRIAQIEADKEVAIASMREANGEPVDWDLFFILLFSICLPVLFVFLYLGYKRHLQHERKRLNDELVINLAKAGQAVTPEMIAAIRQGEEKPCDDKKKADKARELTYQRLCTGGTFIIAGLIILIRNRVVGLVVLVLGLFIAAQGLASWLTERNNRAQEQAQLPEKTETDVKNG